jgi:hypothetical protein
MIQALPLATSAWNASAAFRYPCRTPLTAAKPWGDDMRHEHVTFELPAMRAGPPRELQQWRRRFVELSEDMVRGLGHAAPQMTHDDDMPLSMELEVDDVAFEVIHAPGPRQDEVLIACVVEPPQVGRAVDMWTALLAANLELIREHRSIGADPDSDAILHVARLQLVGFNAPSLHAMTQEMAELAKGWSAGDFAVPQRSPTTRSGDREAEAEAITHRAVFASLIDDVQRLTQSDATVLPGNGSSTDLTVEITLHGFAFKLSHGNCSDPAVFTVECCFGPIPAEQAQDVLLRMLHINRALADVSTGAAFAIDRATGAAVFAKLHLLNMPDGRALLDAMTWMAAQARQWRSTFFLDDDDDDDGDLEPSGLLVSYTDVV